MKPAAEQLQGTLGAIAMQAAAVPVIANVTARPVTDAETIRRLLVEQVVSPVLWEDSVAWLVSEGVDTFVEIGSGTVLAGLIKKVDKSVKVHSINSLSALESFLAEFRA
jgi:[acyl-carrier-protein] S-malonyltransferase